MARTIGAAGLGGHNLILLLQEAGYRNIVAIDKEATNLALLKQLSPQVETICADPAELSDWAQDFEGVNALDAKRADHGRDA